MLFVAVCPTHILNSEAYMQYGLVRQKNLLIINGEDGNKNFGF